MPSLRRSPTVDTLAAFLAVAAAQVAAGLAGAGAYAPFALSLPLAHRPWTLVTSVYAHAWLGHLLTNAVALVVLGSILERGTTRARFHAFFLATGVLAGVVQVLFSALLGTPARVLGASGALFALLGYVLAGNRLTGGLLARVDPSPRVRYVAFALVAVALTLATGAPGVALAAHCTGLFVGLLAGRRRLLAA